MHYLIDWWAAGTLRSFYSAVVLICDSGHKVAFVMQRGKSRVIAWVMLLALVLTFPLVISLLGF